MFLAINEIKHAKLRYGMITSLLFLISYLVFFLAGLANGLAQLNRSAIDNWGDVTVLLANDATQTLNLSSIEKQVAQEVQGDQTAYLSILPTVIWEGENPEEEDKIKSTLFAVDSDSFIVPKVIDGRLMKEVQEVVISKRLADEEGLEIGDVLYLSKSSSTLKIVGIAEEASYNVSPVIYASHETYNLLLSERGPQAETTFNAVLVKGELSSYPKDTLEKLTISEFINKIPGYGAQVLTFGFMIGFLVLISTIVIGIFMYVFTMQKTQIFGVMKTQGVPISYIGRSILVQTFLLVGLGVVLSMGATWLSALALPIKVPFQIDWLFNGLVSIALIVFSMLGSLFSVRIVAGIDPLKTIN
ncbi:ABC transporter permease [Streptococcus minor]|uniref:Putative hemin transport system permease protein HrtB n=1 Tax=Streptococcus minor TaxID=229549 RepID=A0A3P1VCE4_9STRE|nr:ABC transporter permease [Streptococcus minor]RRD31844.1 ABC transporter permease [Streptococcus minor]